MNAPSLFTTSRDRRVQDVVFRGAIALSNAGASLISDRNLVETAAIPAFTNAVDLLKRLTAGLLDDSESSSTTARSNELQVSIEIDPSTLELVESQVRHANRHLSSCRHPGNQFEIPLSNLNCRCIRKLIAISQSSLTHFLDTGLEHTMEMRPIRLSDCSCDQLTSTMQTDLVSAIMLYNFALAFLVLSHITANEPPSGMNNHAISAAAKDMVLTSRQLFRLSMNVLHRYEHILLQQPAQESGWSNSVDDSDRIQSATLFLFVWVSVLMSDYQAALILVLSSNDQPPGAFVDGDFHAQAVFLQQVSHTLLASLDSLYGSNVHEKPYYREGAAAA